MITKNPYASRHELREYIVEQGKIAVASKQLHRRLCKLQSSFLQQLIDEYRQQSFSPAKAKRLALCDTRYTDYIEEIISIGTQALHASIQRETHMLSYRIHAQYRRPPQ